MPIHPSAEDDGFQSAMLKLWLVLCSALYMLSFPFVLYMALLSPMVSDSPSITSFMVGVVMFLMFLLPISIPFGLYLMWSRYKRRQLTKALIFSGLPLYTTGAVFLILGILEAFARNRFPWWK